MLGRVAFQFMTYCWGKIKHLTIVQRWGTADSPTSHFPLPTGPHSFAPIVQSQQSTSSSCVYCVHENNPQRTGHLIITVSVEVALLELVGLLLCAIAERQVVF